MSKWDKLIADILCRNKNLRFQDLCKALLQMGYTMSQPHGGGSHCTFRKAGCMPVTIPKHSAMNMAYIELVAQMIETYQEG